MTVMVMVMAKMPTMAAFLAILLAAAAHAFTVYSKSGSADGEATGLYLPAVSAIHEGLEAPSPAAIAWQVRLRLRIKSLYGCR